VSIHAVDGNAHFSRPGPRLAEGLRALGSLLHPERAAAAAASQAIRTARNRKIHS
jgi:iron complex transport system substrate-binding protein